MISPGPEAPYWSQDAAIVAAGRGAGLTTHGFAKIDEIPYGFFVAGSHAEA